VEEIAAQAAGMVEVPEGGGSEWKTAMEFTALVEDVSSITVDVPNATEIEIMLYGIANNAENTLTSGNANIDANINNIGVARFSMYQRASGAFWNVLRIVRSGSIAYSEKAEHSDNSYGTYKQYTVNSPRHVGGDVSTLAITSITSGILIKAGSKIGIKYR
jgi:hypothetical protein